MAANDEYIDRLLPIIDYFSDEELDRLSRGQGPRLYVLLDTHGMPLRGVIYDPETGRREVVPYACRLMGATWPPASTPSPPKAWAARRP